MVPYVNASILALMDENEFDFRVQNGIFFSGIHNLLTAPWAKFSMKTYCWKGPF